MNCVVTFLTHTDRALEPSLAVEEVILIDLVSIAIAMPAILATDLAGVVGVHIAALAL